MAQCALAALIGVAVVLMAGPGPRNPSALLSWILVGIALAQLPVAVLIVSRLSVLKAVKGARRAALSAAIMTGVLLASTAWFLSLALATGQLGTPVFVLLFLLLTGYAAGFLLVGRLGRVAAAEIVGEPQGKRVEEPVGHSAGAGLLDDAETEAAGAGKEASGGAA